METTLKRSAVDSFFDDVKERYLNIVILTFFGKQHVFKMLIKAVVLSSLLSSALLSPQNAHKLTNFAYKFRTEVHAREMGQEIQRSA
jgi:hypothetical protein